MKTEFHTPRTMSKYNSVEEAPILDTVTKDDGGESNHKASRPSTFVHAVVAILAFSTMVLASSHSNVKEADLAHLRSKLDSLETRNRMRPEPDASLASLGSEQSLIEYLQP